MNEFVKKLVEIEKETSAEKGEYELFALFLREDAPNKWDILVSAGWVTKDNEAALNYLAKKIQSSLSLQELLLISRIVIIDENNPGLLALPAIIVEHGTAEFKESNLFGLEIKHAYLITSKKNRAA